MNQLAKTVDRSVGACIPVETVQGDCGKRQ